MRFQSQYTRIVLQIHKNFKCFINYRNHFVILQEKGIVFNLGKIIQNVKVFLQMSAVGATQFVFLKNKIR